MPNRRHKYALIIESIFSIALKNLFQLHKKEIFNNESIFQIIVVGPKSDSAVKEFLSMITRKYIPDKSLAFIDMDARGRYFSLSVFT